MRKYAISLILALLLAIGVIVFVPKKPMVRMKRILCATDFSICSFRALDRAINFVQRMDAHLEVIHVLQSDKSHAGKGPDLECQVIESHLQDAVQGLLGAKYPMSTDLSRIDYAVIRSEKISSTIIDYARKIEADMIVLGTRGQGGMMRLFLGSVAEEVVRLAPCPVLTVQEGSEPSPIQRILVPIDFSADAREALHLARAFAALFDGHLELLHTVLDPQPPDFYEKDGSWMSAIDVHTRELVENKLEKEFLAVGEKDIAVSFHVRNGHPAKEIVRFVDEHSCDLVVMSTTGLQGFMRFLLGSIAEEVMRKAACPILTVKKLEQAHWASLHMSKKKD